MRSFDQLDCPNEGDPEVVGDCLRACVASIFEIAPAMVPHFMLIERRTKVYWGASLSQWLAPQGLWYAEFPASSVYEWSHFIPWEGIFAVGIGKSPRIQDRRHAVVVKLSDDGKIEIVHDPHPSRSGLKDGVKKVGLFLSRKFSLGVAGVCPV